MKRPQWLIEEAADIYHDRAGENLSSHQLADFRKCPLLYWKKHIGLIPDSDSPAYAFGRAAHTLILEGRDTFEDQYTVGGPINPRTGSPFGSATKAFAQWAAAIGKPVVTDDEADVLKMMEQSVLSHPHAPAFVRNGFAEGVVRTQYSGIPCQIPPHTIGNMEIETKVNAPILNVFDETNQNTESSMLI